MPPRKRKTSPSKTPGQTTYIEPKPQVKNGDILDVDEAAMLLKVSRKTIYNRVKAGNLPHARVGRKLLFSRQKLQQQPVNTRRIDSNRRTPSRANRPGYWLTGDCASNFAGSALRQWIALGGDLAGTMVDNEYSSLEQMLNNGQSRANLDIMNQRVHSNKNLRF